MADLNKGIGAQIIYKIGVTSGSTEGSGYGPFMGSDGGSSLQVWNRIGDPQGEAPSGEDTLTLIWPPPGVLNNRTDAGAKLKFRTSLDLDSFVTPVDLAEITTQPSTTDAFYGGKMIFKAFDPSNTLNEVARMGVLDSTNFGTLLIGQVEVTGNVSIQGDISNPGYSASLDYISTPQISATNILVTNTASISKIRMSGAVADIYGDSTYALRTTVGRFDTSMTAVTVFSNGWGPSNSSAPMTWQPSVPDSTSSVAAIINNNASLTSSGAKLLSIRNNGTEKAYLDYSGSLYLSGTLTAIAKSFLITHPTDPSRHLQYASLEGPENGVYVRGRTTSNTIVLPDYWSKLVCPNSITAHITSIGHHQELFVEKIESGTVYVGGADPVEYFYTVYGERVDIPKLEVEI